MADLVTGSEVGKVWLSLYLAGHKTVTVQQVHAALETSKQSEPNYGILEGRK